MDTALICCAHKTFLHFSFNFLIVAGNHYFFIICPAAQDRTTLTHLFALTTTSAGSQPVMPLSFVAGNRKNIVIVCAYACVETHFSSPPQVPPVFNDASGYFGAAWDNAKSYSPLQCPGNKRSGVLFRGCLFKSISHPFVEAYAVMSGLHGKALVDFRIQAHIECSGTWNQHADFKIKNVVGRANIIFFKIGPQKMGSLGDALHYLAFFRGNC